ncbi:hypothetical protein LC612_28585 [Nostoc sp. CHAB 5834]|nr:hypothetical protein [Nostoc sp. CHAB 5834]
MTSNGNIQNSQSILELLKDFDPNKLVDKAIRAGEEWADLDAAASTLEETRKTVLARLTQNELASTVGGKGISVALAETRALASDEYELHLDLMVSSRREANRKRVVYDLERVRIELMRSVQATKRNEMRLSGYGT